MPAPKKTRAKVKAIIAGVEAGDTIAEASAAIGITRKTCHVWMAQDENFRKKIWAVVRGRRRGWRQKMMQLAAGGEQRALEYVLAHYEKDIGEEDQAASMLENIPLFVRGMMEGYDEQSTDSTE